MGSRVEVTKKAQNCREAQLHSIFSYNAFGLYQSPQTCASALLLLMGKQSLQHRRWEFYQVFY